MKIIIIYLLIGTLWAMLSENISNKYGNKYKEITVDNIEESPLVDWTLYLRLIFIITWPVGVFQVIKNLLNK